MIDLKRRRLVLSGAAVALSAAAPFSGRLGATGHAVGNSVEHRVAIRAFTFEPAILEVRPGDTVIWTNEDFVPHTATAADKSWDTGRIDKGKSVRVAVSGDMTSDYFCRFHPAMKARISLSSDG